MDESAIDVTDPESILGAVAEELFAEGCITTFEACSGGCHEHAAWATFPMADDWIRIMVGRYAPGDAGPGSPAGWEVSASFESHRPPFSVSSLDGESLADFIAWARQLAGAG